MGFTNWAIVTAAFSGVTMFWGQVKGFFDRFSSLFIVTVELHSQAGDAFMQYSWKRFKRSKTAQRRFNAYTVFIRPVSKYGMVAFEMSGKALTFWDGWKPIFVSASTDKDGDYTGNVKVTFLRGMFDIDKLMIDAVTQVNNDHHMKSENSSRFQVKRIFGKSKKDDDSYGGRRIEESENHISASSSMPVGYKRDDIGAAVAKIPFEGLAYPDHIKEFEAEIRRWKNSEMWYKSKNIRWRFGAGLFGPAGTGKTSFVRAIAQDLDMPIHIYDLSTLSNEELVKAWQKSLNATPCVVLFEDLDRIFDKDKNLGATDKKNALTMDALLNCINGVEQSDGILIFVTANDPTKLDSALGVPDETGKSTRPGRLDRIVFFGALDEAGRYDVAKRILADTPEVIDMIVKEGAGETGAQFESRCTKIALEYFWGKPKVLAAAPEPELPGAVVGKLGITKKRRSVSKEN